MSTNACRPAVIAALVLVVAVGASATDQPDAVAQDLKKLSIEELMEIDVTLAARRPEPIGVTAAAISVITSDDIRRAGVTTIADAIALADGVHVARFNNGTWATTARGFNQNTANKLLVMVDGRTVFSPLFAGVFWNTLDYVLEDIDRIEVVRGPGATLWGANAVNGVINIVTRHTRDTQGTYVLAGAGNEDPTVSEVRHGGRAGDIGYRVYGKYAHRDDQRVASGTSADDAVRRGQAGFRLDSGTPDGHNWLVKGDVFHSRFGFSDRPDGEFTDISVQGRYGRALSATSRLTVQSYYRREYRRVPRQLTHRLDTVDVDLQHAFTRGARHNVVWGAGGRSNRDSTEGGVTTAFDPPRRSYPVFNAFAQDEVALAPDRIFLTAGLKVEHNAFSGAEWQPNVRARVLLPRRQMLWSAVARAVRRPTRFEDDILVSAPNGLLLIRGSDDFEAEVLVAWEAGYRMQPSRVVSLDATIFLHDIDRLRSQEVPPTVIPIVVGNTLNGRSSGVELTVNVQPAARWRTRVSYTYLDTRITRDTDSRHTDAGVREANDPHHLFALRTSIDLARHLELDAFLRSVGALPNPAVPAYTELNLRLGWSATPRVELSLVGQDLLHDRHPEFGPDTPGRIVFERGVRAFVALRF